MSLPFLCFMMKYPYAYLLLLIFAFLSACGEKKKELPWEWPKKPDTPDVTPASEKPRFIWIDAAANFPDFADSKENIARDLALAKDAGFTDVVVDVRPTSGDLLFRSSVPGSKPVSWLGAWVKGTYTKIERKATWDYLQVFIDEGHRLGLKVHAGFNTMTGGNSTSLGTEGILFRDASKKNWATSENLASGITNTLNNGQRNTKFFNPVNPEVQDYLCVLLKDLAQYDLDGIFLDRGRFDGIQSDFSDLTRKQFEDYLGKQINNFPDDILPKGATMADINNMTSYPPYFKKWLEFRAKVMHDFMAKARKAVKDTNPKVKFGVYVGGWYSIYYEVGVNWASKKYSASDYRWASAEYRKYGYADLMDQMLIGAYASPLKVYGSTEWTMEGFCRLAKEKIRKDCPMVAGGPDVGNWDPKNIATPAQENEAIVKSVKACMDACDGYFLFDMIHLKLANQWNYAKEGIRLATGNSSK